MQDESSQDNGWEFKPEEARAPSSDPMPNQQESVTWTASEFIAHQKGPSWYALLGVGGGVLCVAAYALTRGDVISTVMVGIAVLALGVFGARQPRVLNYAVDQRGIQIGDHFYPYAMFKSFSVIDEGAIDSIYLMPLKRFMPAITVYFSPEDGERIVQVLGSYLPHEERSHDMVDRLMRKIGF